MKLQQFARTEQAIDLLKRGLRTSLVQQISGLSAPIVRALHHEIHGSKPKPGQRPTMSGLLRSTKRQASASLFVALYRTLGGQRTAQQIELEALLQAHRLYREHAERFASPDQLGAPLDINAAWVIAQALTTGALTLQACHHCQVDFVVCDFSRIALQCPVCVLKQRARQRPPRRQIAKTGQGCSVQALTQTGSDPNQREARAPAP